MAAGAKLLSVIGHANGFDYIAPAVCVKDIAQTDTDEFLSLIHILRMPHSACRENMSPPGKRMRL